MLNIYMHKEKNGTMVKYQELEVPESTSIGELTSMLASLGFLFNEFEILEGLKQLINSGDKGFAEYLKEDGDEVSGFTFTFSK